MQKPRFYRISLNTTTRLVNGWDIIALTVVSALLIIMAWGAYQMAAPYQLGQPLEISLDPSYLPSYALRSVLRIILALIISLIFTFIFGAWAAKDPRAERILIPLIDILQSIPVLSFLSISVVVFSAVFPHSLLGPECASIFAIFTSQAWNIVLSFYQSLRTIPNDLQEAASVFQLSAWQRFWRVEVPFAMPGLLWNTMVSLSASWFFVVASEAISVSKQDIRLPGIGSYIALAIDQANVKAVIYAIITMFLVILIYDQIIFRPLLKWSERFHAHPLSDEKNYSSWVLDLLHRTRLVKKLSESFGILRDSLLRTPKSIAAIRKHRMPARWSKLLGRIFSTLMWLTVIGSMGVVLYCVFTKIALSEIISVVGLGTITALRILILIILASCLWIPIGVWIGMRPRATQIVQPIAQFLAAFPANVVFPVVVILIIRFHLNVEIWLTPLMILGSQWYLLFNVIAGASCIPKDLYQAARNFGVKGFLLWRRLILPVIFPYVVTGAITAAGGAWNASIVAEVVSWGGTSLEATGLGAYITRYTELGDFPRIALGTGVMCIFVLVFNRFVWRPLYQYAEDRFQLISSRN